MNKELIVLAVLISRDWLGAVMQVIDVFNHYEKNPKERKKLETFFWRINTVVGHHQIETQHRKYSMYIYA